MDNANIDIRFNGEPLQVTAGCTITTLLAMQQLTQRRVAVEVNRDIVPRSRHDTHVLKDGDQVEIVHALGGG